MSRSHTQTTSINALATGNQSHSDEWSVKHGFCPSLLPECATLVGSTFLCNLLLTCLNEMKPRRDLNARIWWAWFSWRLPKSG